MNNWNGIQIFLAIVESGQFSGAAKKLQISRSYVSQIISRLELELGSRLFHRSTRHIELSEAGRVFYRYCKNAMSELETGLAAVSNFQATPQGRIRIAALHGIFGESFLSEILGSFLLKHPGIELDLRFFSYPHIEFDGFDLIIGPKPDHDNTLTRLLTRIHFQACASPVYFKDHPIPQKPSDLKQHACILNAIADWEFKKETCETVTVKATHRANSTTALFNLTMMGLGIARLSTYQVIPEVKKGNLVIVLEGWSTKEAEVWISYPDKEYLPLSNRLLIDYLVEYFTNMDVSSFDRDKVQPD